MACLMASVGATFHLSMTNPACAQIRDPYYKFSRDPDMSLDTAPYPAGVPKPGVLAVRS